MPAINFQERFVSAIESGQKTSTIRQKRKRPIKVGDTLYLYTGLRTPNAQLIGTATCSEVNNCTVDIRRASIHIYRKYGSVLLWQLSHLEKLAEKEGFNDPRDMFIFFKQTYKKDVFTGVQIQWRKLCLKNSS